MFNYKYAMRTRWSGDPMVLGFLFYAREIDRCGSEKVWVSDPDATMRGK